MRSETVQDVDKRGPPHHQSLTRECTNKERLVKLFPFSLEERGCLWCLGHVHPWCRLCLLKAIRDRLRAWQMRRGNQAHKSQPESEHYIEAPLARTDTCRSCSCRRSDIHVQSCKWSCRLQQQTLTGAGAGGAGGGGGGGVGEGGERRRGVVVVVVVVRTVPLHTCVQLYACMQHTWLI